MSATIGINTMAVDRPDDFVHLAEMVDRGGFTHMFVADSSLHAHDVYAYLTLLATHSRNVHMGALVTHPYTRHPAINLNALATVNEISGGRVVGNVGAGDRPVMELGYSMSSVQHVRELVEMWRLLQGTTSQVDYAGTNRTLSSAAMNFGDTSMPIYVTATGPRMLQLAGEVADGVFFHVGSDPRSVEYAIENIGIGAHRGGRSLEELTLACCLYGAIGDDREEMRSLGRASAAWFAKTAPGYARIVGVPDDRILAIASAYEGGHSHQARAAHELVNDQMIDAFPVCGSAEVWVDCLKRLETLGIDLFVVFLLPHVATFDGKRRMYQTLIDGVVPYFGSD